MEDSNIDLTKIIKGLLKVLKEQKLNPTIYSVSVILKKGEFDDVVAKHPDIVLPGLVIKNFTEKDGSQWSVQISREISAEDLINNDQNHE